MSSSESSATSQPLGTLLVTAPIGVEIALSDSRFRSLRVGASPLDFELPAGLYNVVWKAGGRSEEQIVRVRAGRSKELYGGVFPLGSAPPSGVEGSSRLEKMQYEAAAKAVVHSGHGDRSEILVIIRSANKRPTSDLGRSVRLSNQHGVDMRSSDADDAALGDPASQLAVRRYPLPPGPYLLRFEAADRRSLEQTVQAFEGRQTVVFLKYGSAMVPEKLKASPRLAPRRGIDPTQTTFVSIPLGGSADQLAETTRLADILLHKLASTESFSDRPLVEILNEPATDPFLKLYGAVLMLGLRTAPDLSVQAVQTPRATAPVRALLDQITADDCPDALCLQWCIDAVVGQSNPASARKLAVPPMLDICWRWAAACSIMNPDIIERSSTLTAAARITQATPPWLVWKVATKADRAAGNVRRDVHPSDQLAQLTAEIASVVTSGSREYGVKFFNASEGFKVLSPQTVEFANAAVSIMSDKRERNADAVARALAYSTGTPGSDLGPRLGEALSELRDWSKV